MRKVISLMHTSLDSFVAGPNGEMDWIKTDEEMFDDVGKLTDEADIALYGRVTYQMMESYWPTAAEQPGATKHDIEHAHWANKVLKIVFSRTLKKTNWNNTRIVYEQIEDEIKKLKNQPGKNLILFGSPSLAQTFMELGLIDECWFYVNPIAIGKGIPLFKNLKNKIDLKLLNTKTFNSGVVALHYSKV